GAVGGGRVGDGAGQRHRQPRHRDAVHARAADDLAVGATAGRGHRDDEEDAGEPRRGPLVYEDFHQCTLATYTPSWKVYGLGDPNRWPTSVTLSAHSVGPVVRPSSGVGLLPSVLAITHSVGLTECVPLK